MLGTMKMYSFLILGMMMPAQTILIPIFTTYVKVGMNNTRIGLILMYVGMNIAFGTFILTGFMKGVPDAVIESGVIDGYVSERPEGISASSANSNFTFVVFEEGQGFEASEDDVAIAVGIKQGRDDLVAQINEILAGISDEERLEIMDNAVMNQPASES